MNKKMLSKVAALTLAVTSFAGLMSGCGKKSEVATCPEGFTEINIWTSGGGDYEIQKQMHQEFNETVGKENKVWVNYQLKDAQALDVARSSGGERPDLWGGNLVEAVEKGEITAIDDMPGGKEFLKTYEGTGREKTNMLNGKTYCVPYRSQVRGLVYNKDMFKAAGIVDENGEAKAPETWDEVVECAKKLTNKEKNEFGIVFPMKWGAWFGYDCDLNTMAVAGTTGYDPRTGKYDYSGRAYIMNKLLQMKNDGSVYPGSETLDNDPARSKFAVGNIGMKFAVDWDVAVWNKQFPAECDWGVAPLPLADKNKPYKQQGSWSYTSYIDAESAKTKADAIMVYLKWMTSDDYAKRAYELGSCLPWKMEIVDGVEPEEGLKGWEEFKNIIQYTEQPPISVYTDTTGTPSLSDEFINKVWTDGSATVEEIVAAAEKAANDGIAKYKAAHPEYEAPAVDPSWKPAMRD